MKKSSILLLCMIMAAMVLSGCAAGNASTSPATAAPIVTNSPMPRVTAQPSIAPMMTAEPSPLADMGMNGGMDGEASMSSAMTPAEAGRLAERIAEAVERISEIDDAEVVIRDKRVLVAVEFNDQYKAGLDDRMKKMITDAVQKEDENLMEIEITDDDTLYGQVKGLGERLAKATGMDELADDFGDLWNRITGM